MSRKGSTPQRTVLPDPKHGSETIARFINMVMQSGKKSVAEKIVYGAMDVIGEKNANALELVEKALGNVSPSVEVKSRRVGGATYQVPVEVRSSRRMNTASYSGNARVPNNLQDTRMQFNCNVRIQKKKIGFFGLFGVGNLGNEITLQTILSHGRRPR